MFGPSPDSLQGGLPHQKRAEEGGRRRRRVKNGGRTGKGVGGGRKGGTSLGIDAGISACRRKAQEDLQSDMMRLQPETPMEERGSFLCQSRRGLACDEGLRRTGHVLIVHMYECMGLYAHTVQWGSGSDRPG